jgi:hypothetical protein
MTPKIPKVTIDYLRELSEKASPAPWEADIDSPSTKHEDWTGSWTVGDGTWCGDDGMPREQEVINARLVAEARNWLPILLDEIERMGKEIEARTASEKSARAILALYGSQFGGAP